MTDPLAKSIGQLLAVARAIRTSHPLDLAENRDIIALTLTGLASAIAFDSRTDANAVVACAEHAIAEAAGVTARDIAESAIAKAKGDLA